MQLPGVADADRMREIIGTTAQLSFRPVIEEIPPGSLAYDEGPDCSAPVDEREHLADDESGILCGWPDSRDRSRRDRRAAPDQVPRGARRRLR